MNILSICFRAVAPIFLTMAAGFGAKKAGWINESDVLRMNRVAFRVFMPLMCFYNIYSSDLNSVIQPRLLAFGLCATLLSFALSYGFGALFIPEPAQRGVTIQGLYRSNYLIVGLAFVTGLTGESGAGAAAVLGAVVVPLFNVLAVVALECNRGSKPSAKDLLKGVVTNPLILGSAAGIAALLLHIRLPAFLNTFVASMSTAASPLTLFLLGAFFRAGSFKSHLRLLSVVCIGRLCIIPGLTLLAAWLFGFRGGELAALIAMSGSSTAVNSFAMAQQMDGDAALAGDIVIATSALCSVTLFLWSVLFMTLQSR